LKIIANAGAAIPEEPPTPLWELILEQFKDQLVLILLGSAAVSFGLALFEEEEGWSAFVDPVVVRCRLSICAFSSRCRIQ
jgi:magnesium-transporting ATPase (P-type)